MAAPELLKLQLENFKLKLINHNLDAENTQAKLRDRVTNLKKEAKFLEAEARVTLKAKPTEVFDWASLTFKPAESDLSKAPKNVHNFNKQKRTN